MHKGPRSRTVGGRQTVRHLPPPIGWEMPKLHVRDKPQPLPVYLYGLCERPMMWDTLAVIFCVVSSLVLARIANAPLRVGRALDHEPTADDDVVAH